MPEITITEFISDFLSNRLTPVLGGCLILWISYRFTVGRDIVNNGRIAGQLIAESFHPELDALIQTNDDARHILTDEAFNKHDSIIRNNIRRLSWVKQFRLRRAWHDLAYFQINNRNSIPFYTMYSDCGSLDKRREMRPLAISRIQKLISIVEC